LHFVVEKTQSRTGLHKRTRRLFIVSRNGAIREYWPSKTTSAKGTYVKGEAYKVDFPMISENECVVYLDFVLNIKKRVKGKIHVYNHKGELKLTLNYDKLKLRRSRGDRSYFWPVKILIEKLNIPVKRINLMTGVD
jgi:hypothetical protein